MRLLFEMDKKDYSGCTHTFTRNSARGIIIKSRVSQNLDDYEKQESFQQEYVEPALAIEKNRKVTESPFIRTMAEREALVLEMLLSEGLIV